jgi:hypothetical protein
MTQFRPNELSGFIYFEGKIIMVNVVHALCLALIVFASGCSSDTAKRTAYETMQNVRQQECMKNPSLSCEKRENFEGYERKRKELDSPKLE